MYILKQQPKPTMKRLITTFIIVLSVSACKNNPSVEKSLENNSQDRMQTSSSTSINIKDEAVLYMVNDRKVNLDYIDALDPDTIESVNVIKDTNELKKYDAEGYQGLVLIKLKDSKQ